MDRLTKGGRQDQDEGDGAVLNRLDGEEQGAAPRGGSTVVAWGYSCPPKISEKKSSIYIL